MNVPVDLITAPGVLWTTEISNHLADSLQIKFTGIVLTCGYATPWSFAHRGHMDMSTDVISVLETLRTPELRNNWADSLQSEYVKYSPILFRALSLTPGDCPGADEVHTGKTHNLWADSFGCHIQCTNIFPNVTEDTDIYFTCLIYSSNSSSSKFYFQQNTTIKQQA